MTVKNKTDLNNKIDMYKALRSVKDKMNKGQLMLLDENRRAMMTEQMFLVTRVLNTILMAEQDPDLADIKWRLDQSDTTANRGW